MNILHFTFVVSTLVVLASSPSSFNTDVDRRMVQRWISIPEMGL
jgi:hypothetical protein